MKRYPFGICGPFDLEERATGGQSVKTREFYLALSEKIGADRISTLESTSYKKNPILFLLRLFRFMCECESIILFPAQKGVRLLAPLCSTIKYFTHTKTYYDVIGGWIADIAGRSRMLRLSLRHFDRILVETNKMKQELAMLGIVNVDQLINFKRIEPICKDEIEGVKDPIRLCYFARVTKMKGIEDVVCAVKRLNQVKLRATLDIYGPVTDGYDSEFEVLKEHFGEGICYRGKVHPSESVQVLRQYDLLVFPTRYATEGIPASIIDGYFSGVPVVAARWNSFSDLVVEGKTGIGFEMGNTEDLCEKLDQLIDDPKKILEMKYACLKEAERYTPEKGINRFLEIVSMARR